MDSIKAQLKDYYNKYADERNSNVKNQWKVDLRDDFLAVIKEKGLKSMLEIGAGTGQDSIFFMKEGFVVTAVDLSEEHVKRCREKGVDAIVMDFSKMTFSDNSFDAIYSMNCLLHIPNDELFNVMREMKRVLKPNGIMFLCQYGDKHKSSEGISNNNGKGERFFSFRTYNDFTDTIISSGLSIVKSGTIELGEENYNSQYFVIEKS
jgi:ubiquinone/menaquinone biosynthesis C-methylase UbiE